jgi:hypothetical protein
VRNHLYILNYPFYLQENRLLIPLNEAKAFAMASVGVPKFTAIAIAKASLNYVSQVIQSENL